MISAEEFIDILEQKDLLDPSLVRDLRRRVEQSMAPVSAALLAKRLVDKGHLSRKLAQRLLDRAELDEQPAAPPPGRRSAENRPQPGGLGLAPLEEEEEDEELKPAEEAAHLEMNEEEDWGLQELDDEKPWRPPTVDQPPPTAKPSAPASPAAPIPPATLIQPAVPIRPAPPAASIPPAAPVSPAPSLIEGLEEIEELGGPLDQLGAGGAVYVARPKRQGKDAGGGEKRSVWDSKLMLIGGGTLLFLIIMLLVFVFVLAGRGADAMLAQAEKYYEDGAYKQAEDSYAQFVKKFPKHAGIGKARIRLSLAKMRQAVGGEWPHALDVAKAEIPLISGEGLFATEARPELASLLPDIAEGLAGGAQRSHDSKTADLADEALRLVEKYVPSASRPQERLQEIEALIALTRREIARDEQLVGTVAAMIKAAEEGQPQTAYSLRHELLKEYPVLRENESLASAVRTVSAAEQAAVKQVQQAVKPLTDEPETKAVATVGLAQRNIQSPLAGVAEQRIFAVAGGAVYGLEASEGKVLWRRDIGFEQNVRGAQCPPIPVSDSPGADPLMVSRSRQELLRVEASTGKIRWRFPVAEPFDAHPVVIGSRVYVATLSGRLVSLDLETGDSAGYTQLPQPLRVGPVGAGSGNDLYQVGEHSSLFVLSAADGSCSRVIYLAHESGSIIVPPVRISHYLLICENDRVRDSVVKVLDISPPAPNGETPPFQVVQQVRLKGHHYLAPIVNGPQVLIATDAGAVSVFQLTGVEGKEPLSLSAEGTAPSEEQSDLVRYATMATGRIWIAGTELTQYAVRASERRLNPAWTVNQASVSLQPPVVAGEAVIHVRHRQGLPGVAVSAVSSREGVVCWETTLASPVAGTPIVEDPTKPIVAATAVGGVFQIPPPAEGTVAFHDTPTRIIPGADLTGPVRQVLGLPGGMVAMLRGSQPADISVFVPGPAADAARIRSVALSSPLSGDATALAGGLLVPVAEGRVLLLDPATGSPLARPFQPPLVAGRKYKWSRPEIIGRDQFVIADDSGAVHRVVVKEDPEKHLAVAATAQLEDPIASPIAVLGNRVYAVDRTDSFVRLDLPGLTDRVRKPLGARCVVGPVRIGEHVLLITSDNLMHVVDSSGKMRSDKLPHGVPTGEPLVEGPHWLFASASGVVWRVDPATGEQLAQEETGLALGSGLALLGSRLLVAGHDGTLYLLAKP